MSQLQAAQFLAVSLLLGMTAPAVAGTQQIVQAQQNRALEQRFEQRLRAATTPEERAQIEAERDRARQESAVPAADSNIRGGRGTPETTTPGGGPAGANAPGESGSPGAAGVPSGSGGGSR